MHPCHKITAIPVRNEHWILTGETEIRADFPCGICISTTGRYSDEDIEEAVAACFGSKAEDVILNFYGMEEVSEPSSGTQVYRGSESAKQIEEFIRKDGKLMQGSFEGFDISVAHKNFRPKP